MTHPLLNERGIVVMCDSSGIVLQLLRDDLNLAEGAQPGASLESLVDPAAREKLELFLAELRSRHAAYDWEITVPVQGILTPLHFAGARIDKAFLVVVAFSRGGLAHLNADLMLINNEQTNALRAALKDLSIQARKPASGDDRIYDDLSRLNNELANLQREMARKNAELERLNEQKNRFLGMAAHDLRSPLGIILAYSEFLETEAADALTEEQREFVTTIKETSEFMLRLVVDLLDVSTIESGQLNLKPQQVDVAHLIQRNVTLNRALAAKKAITVDFEAPVAPCLLSCDPGKIEQVLNNLIGNAVKFSHRDRAVRVRLETSPESATISVEDHGQGIPLDDLPKVFKPFSKVSVHSTAGEPSTGLGLAICRKMIEGHGGRLWVESTVGAGSTFSFTLPAGGRQIKAEALGSHLPPA